MTTTLQQRRHDVVALDPGVQLVLQLHLRLRSLATVVQRGVPRSVQNVANTLNNRVLHSVCDCRRIGGDLKEGVGLEGELGSWTP